MYDIEKTYCARSIPEALDLLAENPGAVLTAGGTDVMIRLRERKLRRAVLISILEIPELRFVRLDENKDLLLGPGACFDALCASELVRSCVPLLVQACGQVGSPQIRNIATIGGNLCNGAVSADSAPPLLALDAELTLTGRHGERVVPLNEFYTGPGKTVLDQNRELLSCIRIRRESYENRGGCYLKFGQRNAMEISTLGCAVNCGLDPDGTICGFAIAFGVAAPRPIRCPRAEAMMLGRRPSERLLEALRAAVAEETTPRDGWRASKQLRLQLIREGAVRAAREAIFSAGGTLV